MTDDVKGKTAKNLGFVGLMALVGTEVHLEFSDDPEFHINLVLPEDLREATIYEWGREGSVAYLPSRKEWPTRIYESTRVVPVIS